jgi:hypothetical protein
MSIIQKKEIKIKSLINKNGKLKDGRRMWKRLKDYRIEKTSNTDLDEVNVVF